MTFDLWIKPGDRHSTRVDQGHSESFSFVQGHSGSFRVIQVQSGSIRVNKTGCAPELSTKGPPNNYESTGPVKLVRDHR